MPGNILLADVDALSPNVKMLIVSAWPSITDGIFSISISPLKLMNFELVRLNMMVKH
jgi:hypothetical protein